MQALTTSCAQVRALQLVDVPQARSYEVKRRFTREPSIHFLTHNARGVRLFDALKGNFLGLVDPDEQVISVNSDKISYMFEVLTDSVHLGLGH